MVTSTRCSIGAPRKVAHRRDLGVASGVTAALLERRLVGEALGDEPAALLVDRQPVGLLDLPRRLTVRGAGQGDVVVAPNGDRGGPAAVDRDVQQLSTFAL